MKVTLRRIKESERVLTKILTFPMAIRTAYSMRKLSEGVMKELKSIDESRLELVKKYGKKVGETENLQVEPKNVEAFTNEFYEFLNMEINLPVQKIKLDDLNGLKLSIAEFNAVDYLIEEPIEEKPVKDKKEK